MPYQCVYRYTDNGKERVYDHPLYHVLHDEPNKEMTSFVFRETLMSHLLIWGNAFAQIIRDGRGQVLALYPLLPDKMQVDRAENGELYYIYSRNSEENPNFKDTGDIILRKEEVLHIPGLGFDGLIGYSPIAMAKNAVGMTIACEEYTLEESCFIWHRKSNNETADVDWDSQHIGMKSVIITTEDVQDNASFYCEITL